MRLNSIKLSGFKSFAEPTTLRLPGQLVGVVGPNGCGKSNIMDAVRWVLGESRASELRGQSMQDVIFNGTTSRKAATRTQVELVFDNSGHRAGGQWNAYTEISVKRQLTRDGASTYYINNQAVRRRDVHDVFLGTGLGPRAYAIIGQGTISRIIESRPEELRFFLEEAAGVSKYKERRRETENRLADSRENLTRVQDILRELNRNLDRLERQARVAQKYHELQSTVALRQNQLWLLKRQHADAEVQRLREEVAGAETTLQAHMAQLRGAESGLESTRQAHYAAGDELSKAQALLYEASAEAGKLEAEIRYVSENRERAQARLTQLQAQAGQWSERRSEAEQELAALANREQEAQREVQTCETRRDATQQELPRRQADLQAAREGLHQRREALAGVQQRIHVLVAERSALRDQVAQASARRERLLAERGTLPQAEADALQQLAADLESAQAAAQAAVQRLGELQDRIPELERARSEGQQLLNAEIRTETDLSARLEALRALQADVTTSEDMQRWLQQHGLADLPQLWTRVRVEAGWEDAMEAALRERLGGLEVQQLEALQTLVAEAPPAKLTLYATGGGAMAEQGTGLPRLAERLQLHDAALQALLAGWLQGCYTAPSLAEALQQRHRLRPGEAIYLRSGHCVEFSSLSFHAPDSERAGLLARARQIEDTEKQLRAQRLIREQAGQALQQAEAAHAQASAALTEQRGQASRLEQQAHQLQLKLVAERQRAEQLSARRAQIDADLAELDELLADLRSRDQRAQVQATELDSEQSQAQQRLGETGTGEQEAEQRLQEARERHGAAVRELQESQFALRSLQSRRDELRRIVDSAQQQAADIASEQERGRDELARLSDAAAQAGLQDALALKLAREQALGAQRSVYDDLSARLRQADEARLALEQAVEPQRAGITQLQLKEQAARLGAEQYAQMLADAEADLEQVAQSLGEGPADMEALQRELSESQERIQRLGAVNLAALEELGTARERKTFLDAQSADLTEAMYTLEDAIRKIDVETRTLLGTTFDQVNEHFGRMFPQLFGGGQARLVMTGEEILDSGVEVMAQPPGKKNQTIRLLSGGEKALTAIALVFAIFELNPAPFCLLDEVDAPLDDANTERYARLVTTMSQQGTQFLFISHNKLAMEMASQLIGVTMQEEGVSRIVAVDMEDAVRMAEAA